MAYSFGPGMEARGWKKTLYIDLVTPSAVINRTANVKNSASVVLASGSMI